MKTAVLTLSHLLRIRPGEGARVVLMLVYSVAAVGGVVITGQLASRVLFLGQLSGSDLPYKFILPPLSLMLVAALYGQIANCWRRDHLIIGTCLLAIAGFLGLRLLLALPAGHSFASVCGLYVFTDVVSALVVLQFWTFAGDIFDPREARRLFGLIAGGSTLSNLLFGGALSLTADRIEPAQLLYIVSLSLLVCVICVAALGRRCAGMLRLARQFRPGAQATTVDACTHPLVLSLAGLVLIVTIVSNVADYQLDLALRALYGSDTAGMLSFLGTFRAIAGIGAFVLQFFVASRLVDRFGLIAALLLLPAAIAVGGSVILLTAGALWAVAIPRAGDVVLKYTVHDAAVNLLFLPLGDRLRARAKALIDGILKPPIAAAAGLVFLWVGPGTTPADWVPALFVCVALWWGLARRARSQYVETLSQSLRLRRLDPDRVGLDLSDPASVRVLRDALRSPDAMRITHALGWLDGMATIDWTPDVTPLVQHEDAQVRAAAVALLGRQSTGKLDAALERALGDPDPTVRQHAVEAYAAHGRTRELRPLYDDPSVGVRSALVRGLLTAATDDARTQFERLATADDPAARAAAAGLHMLTDAASGQWFTRLLTDPHEDVVAATLRGGARSQPPPWPQGWLQFFDSPRLRPAATELAQAWARQDAAVLIDCVDAADTPDNARLSLVAALEPATGNAVASALQRWLQSADDTLRGATLAVILARRDRQGLRPPASHPVEGCLSREMETALCWQTAARDLAHLAEPLLDDALRRRFVQARDRCLMCLDLLFADLSHSRVTRSLEDRDPRQAAAAVELIDQILPRRLATGLLPLFDEATGTVSGVAPEIRLTDLAATPDPWLSACAARALHKLHHPDETGAITTPLSVLEKVFFLKSVSLFHSLSGEEIAQIVPIVGEREYAAGDMIIKRGQEGDCLYILVEGDVSVTLADGRQRLLTSREVIGELAVLAERPRSADCRAVSDVVALRIDKTAFWQLLDERPDIAIEVMKVLVDRYVPSDG